MFLFALTVLSSSIAAPEESPAQTLTRDMIRVVMDPAVPSLSKCGSRKETQRQGNLKFTVHEDGSVSDVTSAGFSVRATLCMKPVILLLRFPRLSHAVLVDVPIALHPKKPRVINGCAAVDPDMKRKDDDFRIIDVDLKPAIKGALPRWQKCAPRGVGARVVFAIEDDGTVTTASAETASHDAVMEGCLRDATLAMRFPPQSQRRARVSVPIWPD